MEELLEALHRDNLVKLKKILESGIDLNTPVLIGEEYELSEPDETNILFYAIRTDGSIEAIEMLLEYGMDIAMFDENGISALDTAIKFKRYDVVALCIEKGIDLGGSKRKSGITPLMLAACFGDTRSAQMLIDNGVDMDSSDMNGMKARDYARKLGQKKFEEFLKEKGASYGIYKDV